ncbi:hypothetical protein [Streptomyces swartbergensis]|uniref:hypothetical protein n=1 Tax=Streptomyces swartbergensis TaxID=487165 RepID=UPI003830E300
MRILIKTGVVATAVSGLLAVAPGVAAAQAVSDAGRSAAVAGDVHKPAHQGRVMAAEAAARAGRV